MLKKYWREFAIFLLIATVMAQYHSCQNARAKIAAGIIAEQTITKLNNKIREISKKYAAEYVKLDKQIADANADANSASARADKFYSDSKAAQSKIRELASVNDQLQATNYELELCQQFVLKQRDDFNNSIKALDLSYNARISLMREEYAVKEARLTNEIGRITKTVAYYMLKDKRRFVFGPSVGYGVNGFYIGVGITFRVLEFNF